MSGPATIFPGSHPLTADIDTMIRNGYWYEHEIVDKFYPAYVGMFGDQSDNTYWFWHTFVSVDGVIGNGVDVTMMYQMGDENSDWEGVHILGTTNMVHYNYQMSPITLSNAGWY